MSQSEINETRTQFKQGNQARLDVTRPFGYRKMMLRRAAQFEMDVIRMQERKQEEEETARLIAFFEELEERH